MKRFLAILTVAVLLFVSGGPGAYYPPAARAEVTLTDYSQCMYMNFATYQALPYAMTTSKIPFMATDSSRMYGTNPTITNVVQAYYVEGTNNGSNYWKLHFARLDTYGDLFLLATCSPRTTCSANVWDSDYSTQDYTLSDSMLGLYVLTEKVGSPGALYLASPAVCLN